MYGNLPTFPRSGIVHKGWEGSEVSGNGNYGENGHILPDNLHNKPSGAGVWAWKHVLEMAIMGKWTHLT
jgi:hypothetical protein